MVNYQYLINMKEDSNYIYNSNFKEVVNLKVLKKQVFINALSTTKNIEEAALRAGVSKRTIFKFTNENNINNYDIQLMRKAFIKSGKKVKPRLFKN